VGVVARIDPEGEARRVRVAVPGLLGRYLVEKGSVTIDGVSLTVTAVSSADADDAWFEVVLIPHTLDVTVLGRRRIGDAVNLEMDVIAKYVERMMEARS
jgi:riboflavin synthase